MEGVSGGFAAPSYRTTSHQPDCSGLEEELGLKLFLRAKRVAQLTPEGALFYAEALRTLAQAEAAINTPKRAAKGQIGQLAIGSLGSATYAFLPELVRKYKAQFKLSSAEASRFFYRIRCSRVSPRPRLTTGLLTKSFHWRSGT